LRKPTRRRYYARITLVGQFTSALGELQKSIELASQPPAESPLTISLGNVVKTLTRAIEYEKMYQLGRKRIQAALVREKKAIEQLLADVKGVPITQDEKLLAKRKVKGAGK